MSDLRLRARSVAEIVDAAFQLYRRDALQYILLAAVAYAPVLVAQLMILGAGVAAGASSAAASVAALSFVVVLIAMVAFAIMTSAITRFSADVYLGQPRDVGAAVRAVMPRFWTVIGAWIGYIVVMAAAAIPIGILVTIASLSGNPLLTVVGFIGGLLAFPYLFARYFAVFQIVILENLGIVDSFRRSAALSRGRKGHILLTLLLVWIVFAGMYFAVLLFSFTTKSQVVSGVLGTIYSVIAYPLIAIVQTLLYYDARIRNEGFDIEMMTGELPPARPAHGVAQ